MIGTIRYLLNLFSRYARPLLAAGVFVGILLPDLAQILRPYLTPIVVGTLIGALLRLDWLQLRSSLKQSRLLAQLAIWQLIFSPLIAWGSTVLLGLPPGISLALILQTAAPPIGSAAVFVMLLKMDASLTMLTSVITVLLLPLTLTPLVAALPDSALQIDLVTFFLRVSLLVITPFVIAWLLRYFIGVERLQNYDNEIGGLNVILLMMFAIGVMDGVTEQLLDDPVWIAQLLALSCLMAVLLHLGAYLVFMRAGLNVAISAAICSGNRNMGLMLAITAGSAVQEFSLYVGVAQIPMYFMPLLINFCLLRFGINPNISK